MIYRLKKALPFAEVGSEVREPEQGDCDYIVVCKAHWNDFVKIAIPDSIKDEWLEPMRWKPELNEHYWHFDSFGVVYGAIFTTHTNGIWLKSWLEFGNYFKTEKEATAARDAVKETLKKFHEGV